MWGEHTHISIMEYWRWWVVHLWVEGVFEVFATAVISLLFVRMGLLREPVAATMVMLATIIFLFGGVLGTFHHLYFSGTPLAVLAIGAVFSALEVVPLMVVGFEAYNHARLDRQRALYTTPYLPRPNAGPISKSRRLHRVLLPTSTINAVTLFPFFFSPQPRQRSVPQQKGERKK